MATTFNHEEVQLLLDSLASHEKSGASGRMMGSMLGAMLCRDDDARKKFEQEEERRFHQERIKERKLSEDCTLLRAKLIQYRREVDSQDADKLLSDASK